MFCLFYTLFYILRIFVMQKFLAWILRSIPSFIWFSSNYSKWPNCPLHEEHDAQWIPGSFECRPSCFKPQFYYNLELIFLLLLVFFLRLLCYYVEIDVQMVKLLGKSSFVYKKTRWKYSNLHTHTRIKYSQVWFLTLLYIHI